MANPELTNLRRARSRCHLQLKNTEAIVDGYRTKLASLEARIKELAPELDLPIRFRKPNPYFARGELHRMTVDMLRDAGRPLSVREMAVAALAAKGVRFPDRRTMKQTRTRIRDVMARLGARGLTVTVGTGKATKRALV